MKNNHENIPIKIWTILYPILIYYVISNVAMYLFVYALQITEETYSHSYTMLQTIATALCLPVLFGYYRKDRLLCTVFQQRLQQGTKENTTKTKISKNFQPGSTIMGRMLFKKFTSVLPNRGKSGLTIVSRL